jgi:hypothetical protein
MPPFSSNVLRNNWISQNNFFKDFSDSVYILHASSVFKYQNKGQVGFLFNQITATLNDFV